jgi:uncharacterized protein
LVLSLSSIGKEAGEFRILGRSEDLPELTELGCSGELSASVKSVPTVTSHWLEMVVRGSISLDCGRCLEKLTGAFEVKVRLLVEQKEDQGLEWIEDEDQGVEEYLVKIGPDVTDIPLEHPIAEQILLNYNLHPMPSLDDKNRCLQCGRTAFSPEPQQRKDRVDPRWEKLQNLKKPDAGNGKKD